MDSPGRPSTVAASTDEWESEWRKTTEFHEHVGFLALMLVCAGCAIYLMGVLEPIVRPFLWALFLVMGLQPAVTCVEKILLVTFGIICRCTVAMVGMCCRAGRCSAHKGGSSLCCLRACRRASRLTGGAPLPTLLGAAALKAHNEIARARAHDGNSSEEDDYDHYHDLQTIRRVQVLAHLVAVALVVVGVLFMVGGTVLLLVQSAVSLKGNWEVYQQGATALVDSVQVVTSEFMTGIPQDLAEELATEVLGQAEAFISSSITEILGNCGRLVFEMLMMALYIAFWLADPVPVSSDMEDLFRRYLILKGTACAGYGICVGICLHALSIDLAPGFGFLAFCLSFVPEVGAIVSMALPAPVILLDSRLKSPVLTLMSATAAQLTLKFIFANVVEVKLVETDAVMKMHPVVILLVVALFGYIWGPPGMLLSVPIVAYLKVTLLSPSVPRCYRDPVLIFLEGDKCAPQRHSERLRRERQENAEVLEGTELEALLPGDAA